MKTAYLKTGEPILVTNEVHHSDAGIQVKVMLPDGSERWVNEVYYAKPVTEINTELFEALIAAKDHLEYCGYGDAWEREVARASGLEERIEKAITNATKNGNS